MMQVSCRSARLGRESRPAYTLRQPARDSGQNPGLRRSGPALNSKVVF